MDPSTLSRAETELTSLLTKCESVLRNSSLSQGRTTLMNNRVEALHTALTLIRQAQDSAST